MNFLQFRKLSIIFAILVISCYAPIRSQAQKTNDSLLSVLVSRDLSDTNRIKLLVDVSEAYMNINIDSAILFANQALSLAEKINYSSGIAECRQYLGNAYITLNDYDKAQTYLKASLEQYLSVSNMKGEAKVFRLMGNLYFQKFKYDSALYYYNVSIVLSKQIHDNKNVGFVTIDIASIYNDRGNFSKALDTYEAAMWLLKMEKDDKGMCLCLGNIATLYISIGDYKKAAEYNKQCLDISEKINDRLGVLSAIANEGIIYASLNDNVNALAAFKRQYKLADSLGNIYWKNIALSNIGDTYRSLKMPDSAMKIYKIALRQAEKTNDSNVIAAINSGMGDILNKQGNSTEAIKHLIITYNIVKSNDIMKSVAEVSQDLSAAYEKIQDYKHAYYYLKICHTYSDSIHLDNNVKKNSHEEFVDVQQQKNEQMKLAEKDIIIKSERTENHTNLILFTSLLAVVAISGSILLYRFNKLKKDYEDLKS